MKPLYVVFKAPDGFLVSGKYPGLDKPYDIPCGKAAVRKTDKSRYRLSACAVHDRPGLIHEYRYPKSLEYALYP